MVSDRVEVCFEIKIDDVGLALCDCLRYSLHRLMRRFLGTIAIRTRLEIRLEDRLHNELQSTLYDSVPDRRYRKGTELSSGLRYLLLP